MDPREMRRKPDDWSWFTWYRWRLLPWWPTPREMVTAWEDVAAWARGYCNHCPRQVGGYAFWRCGLRRGHALPHRSRNYVWDADGVRYAPLPAPAHPAEYAAQGHRRYVMPQSTASRLAHYRETRALMDRLRAERAP